MESHSFIQAKGSALPYSSLRRWGSDGRQLGGKASQFLWQAVQRIPENVPEKGIELEFFEDRRSGLGVSGRKRHLVIIQMRNAVHRKEIGVVGLAIIVLEKHIKGKDTGGE